MQSLKSPYILYNQQSVGSTLHNNLLFITASSLIVRKTHGYGLSHGNTSLVFALYILII